LPAARRFESGCRLQCTTRSRIAAAVGDPLPQRRLSVRTSTCKERLQEIVEARGHLLALHQARRTG